MIRQRSADVTPHAAGVREYVPGDPMKRIHWPSTAHKGRLMVKEFEQDPQADIWIFLDAQQEVQVRQPEPEPGFIGDGLWLHRPKLIPPTGYIRVWDKHHGLTRGILPSRPAGGWSGMCHRQADISPSGTRGTTGEQNHGNPCLPPA